MWFTRINYLKFPLRQNSDSQKDPKISLVAYSYRVLAVKLILQQTLFPTRCEALFKVQNHQSAEICTRKVNHSETPPWSMQAWVEVCVLLRRQGSLFSFTCNIGKRGDTKKSLKKLAGRLATLKMRKTGDQRCPPIRSDNLPPLAMATINWSRSKMVWETNPCAIPTYLYKLSSSTVRYQKVHIYSKRYYVWYRKLYKLEIKTSNPR